MIVVISGLNAQTLKEANKYFERYEYAKAAKAYEEASKTSTLLEEDYKQYGYALFVTGQFKKCIPISDSIVKISAIEPYFWYLNGQCNMAEGNFSKAKSAFEKYQKLDDEYNVSNKITSCEMIPGWKDEVFVSNTLYGKNTTKANFTGATSYLGELSYREIGRDSVGGATVDETLDDSELMLSRPYITKNGQAQQVVIEDTLSDISVTSIAYHSQSGKAYLTISKPLSNSEVDFAPHIYSGNFDPSGKVITDLEPWEYAGFVDTTATAHATINWSGTMMVFSKMGPSTLGADLFLSQFDGAGWSKPERINSLCSELDELYPLFMGDTLLSFSSDGRPGYGGLDIFTAEVDGDYFKNIVHLRKPVNSFSDDFNFVYYSLDSARYTSNREGGIGDDDMYFIKLREKKIQQVEEPDSSDFNDFVSNWVVPKVYFDFDKFNIKKDIANMDKMVEFMRNYPSSKLTISGHTDSRGTVDYNFNLGYSRAQAVKTALVKAGINSNQISISSKGYIEPEIDCGQKCTEEQHSLNRVAIIRLDAK